MQQSIIVRLLRSGESKSIRERERDRAGLSCWNWSYGDTFIISDKSKTNWYRLLMKCSFSFTIQSIHQLNSRLNVYEQRAKHYRKLLMLSREQEYKREQAYRIMLKLKLYTYYQWQIKENWYRLLIKCSFSFTISTKQSLKHLRTLSKA